MTTTVTGYRGPGYYLWRPYPGVAQRIFVGPPPAERQFPEDWIAFYETAVSDDYVQAYKRKFADPFLTKIEEGGA